MVLIKIEIAISGAYMLQYQKDMITSDFLRKQVELFFKMNDVSGNV